MTNYLSPIFGLVTASDPTSENGGLFFAHYLVLKLMLGLGITRQDVAIYTNKMYQAYVGKGLYLRSAHHEHRTVSQDEITGMMVASNILGTWHDKAIWIYLARNMGNYPATGESKYYNPANFYSWGLLAGSSWSFIFAPLYTINLLISANKPLKDTSSKLIYLTELYVMKDKSLYSRLLWKYYTWKMTRMYGAKWVKALYDIYFAREPLDHPLRELSGKI